VIGVVVGFGVEVGVVVVCYGWVDEFGGDECVVGVLVLLYVGDEVVVGVVVEDDWVEGVVCLLF